MTGGIDVLGCAGISQRIPPSGKRYPCFAKFAHGTIEPCPVLTTITLTSMLPFLMPPSDIVCEAVLLEWRAMWYGFIVTIHAFPVHEKSRVNLL